MVAVVVLHCGLQFIVDVEKHLCHNSIRFQFFDRLPLPVYMKGQATDIQIQAEEILNLKRQINNIYVKHTKQPLAVVGWSIVWYHLYGFPRCSVIATV